MAQELVINTWCDACMVEERRLPGRTVEAFGGRVIDLCEVHEKELVKPLADLVAAHGRRAEGPAPSQARAVTKRKHTPASEGEVLVNAGPEAYPFSCLICPATPPTGSALGAHLRARHGSSITEVYGNRCPVCGRGFGGTGLGMHLNRAHGSEGGAPVAFAWARANGDPAGVVAERLAALAR